MLPALIGLTLFGRIAFGVDRAAQCPDRALEMQLTGDVLGEDAMEVATWCRLEMLRLLGRRIARAIVAGSRHRETGMLRPPRS